MMIGQESFALVKVTICNRIKPRKTPRNSRRTIESDEEAGQTIRPANARFTFPLFRLALLFVASTAISLHAPLLLLLLSFASQSRLIWPGLACPIHSTNQPPPSCVCLQPFTKTKKKTTVLFQPPVGLLLCPLPHDRKSVPVHQVSRWRALISIASPTRVQLSNRSSDRFIRQLFLASSSNNIISYRSITIAGRPVFEIVNSFVLVISESRSHQHFGLIPKFDQTHFQHVRVSVTTTRRAIIVRPIASASSPRMIVILIVFIR